MWTGCRQTCAHLASLVALPGIGPRLIQSTQSVNMLLLQKGLILRLGLTHHQLGPTSHTIHNLNAETIIGSLVTTPIAELVIIVHALRTTRIPMVIIIIDLVPEPVTTGILNVHAPAHVPGLTAILGTGDITGTIVTVPGAVIILRIVHAQGRHVGTTLITARDTIGTILDVVLITLIIGATVAVTVGNYQPLRQPVVISQKWQIGRPRSSLLLKLAINLYVTSGIIRWLILRNSYQIIRH